VIQTRDGPRPELRYRYGRARAVDSAIREAASTRRRHSPLFATQLVHGDKASISDHEDSSRRNNQLPLTHLHARLARNHKPSSLEPLPGKTNPRHVRTVRFVIEMGRVTYRHLPTLVFSRHRQDSNRNIVYCFIISLSHDQLRYELVVVSGSFGLHPMRPALLLLPSLLVVRSFPRDPL